MYLYLRNRNVPGFTYFSATQWIFIFETAAKRIVRYIKRCRTESAQRYVFLKDQVGCRDARHEARNTNTTTLGYIFVVSLINPKTITKIKYLRDDRGAQGKSQTRPCGAFKHILHSISLTTFLPTTNPVTSGEIPRHVL